MGRILSTAMALPADIDKAREQPCRFLYVIGQLTAGGSERQLYLLLKGMDRERYLPHVVVWRYRETDAFVSPLQKLGVTLHAMPQDANGAVKLAAFCRLAKQLMPEVIQSYSFYTNFAAWFASLTAGSLALGAVRSNFFNDLVASGRLLGRLSGRWPQTQIYNNYAAAESVRAGGGSFVPKRILVVPNGLDLERFSVQPLPATKRFRILGIGSLIPLKRWDRLLRVAKRLKDCGHDFQIEICGNGPLKASLVDQAKKFGLQETVSFQEYSADIPGKLSQAHLLVHTSDVEGAPNVVTEAMAARRAVIATAVGDVPRIVKQGETGFVVEPGDEDQLLARIQLLVEDRALCDRMGAAARKYAEQNFGLQQLVERTLDAYAAAGWSHR